MAIDSVDTRVRALLRAGNLAGAATEALTAHGPAVSRYLISLLRSEVEAAEAYSAFSESLWASLPTFRGEASLRTWCFRLAWSAARDLQRDAWRRRVRRLATHEASILPAAAPTTTRGRAEEQRSRLDALRQALSLEERSLLELRVDQELSWAEIASVLSTDERSVDPGAAEKRFERLKQRLARLARREGLLE